MMYLFIDTETTGLPVRGDASWQDTENWPRIVELAWLLCDSRGNPIGESTDIIRPGGFVIPPEASAIHGITTQMALDEGISLDEALLSLSAACRRAEVLIAHNVDFDQAVIAAEMTRTGLSPSAIDLPRVCTMKSSVDYCRIMGPYGYKWPRLSELHVKLFGTLPEKSHRGRDDVRTCARCYFALKERGNLP